MILIRNVVAIKSNSIVDITTVFVTKMDTSDLQALGIPNPSFDCNNVFSNSSNQTQQNLPEVITAEVDPCQVEFEFHSQADDDAESELERKYQEVMREFYSEVPEDKDYKHWAEMILNSPHSESTLQKALITREYESLK